MSVSRAKGLRISLRRDVMCRQVACVEMADSAQRPLREGSKWELCGMIRGSNVLSKATARTLICRVGLDNSGHSWWAKAVATERCPSEPILVFFVTTVQIWVIPSPVPFPFLICVPLVFRATYSYGLNTQPANSPRNLVSTIIYQRTCCHVPDDKSLQ